jgi:hypothetical protein
MPTEGSCRQHSKSAQEVAVGTVSSEAIGAGILEPLEANVHQLCTLNAGLVFMEL